MSRSVHYCLVRQLWLTRAVLYVQRFTFYSKHNNHGCLFQRKPLLILLSIFLRRGEMPMPERDLEFWSFSKGSRRVEKKKEPQKENHTTSHWKSPTNNSYRPRQTGSNFTLQAGLILFVHLVLFGSLYTETSLPVSLF